MVDNFNKLCQMICHDEPNYPDYLSPEAFSLVKGLLEKDPRKRMTIQEAKKHAFFRDLDWEDVHRRKLTPPIVPEMKTADSTDNFEAAFTCKSPSPVLSSKRKDPQTISPDLFKDF